MIVSLRGTLVSATPLSAVIDVGGVGYEVNVPITSSERLPAVGKEAHLHTVAVYREDSQALFGFATAEERDFFRLLVGNVSGVGPKVALTIMSRLSLPILRAAIADGDVGLLSKCHGIGKKTAERVVVELKDKIGAEPATSAPPAAGAKSATVSVADTRSRDAVLALTALGYKIADAEKSIRKAAQTLGGDAGTEELIKHALNG